MHVFADSATYFSLTFHKSCVPFSPFTTLFPFKINVFICMRFTLALKYLLEKVL